MKKVILPVLLSLVAAPAFADCQTEMDALNTSLESAQLDDATKASVDEMKVKASEEMAAGNEEACMATVGDIKKAAALQE